MTITTTEIARNTGVALDAWKMMSDYGIGSWLNTPECKWMTNLSFFHSRYLRKRITRSGSDDGVIMSSALEDAKVGINSDLRTAYLKTEALMSKWSIDETIPSQVVMHFLLLVICRPIATMLDYYHQYLNVWVKCVYYSTANADGAKHSALHFAAQIRMATESEPLLRRNRFPGVFETVAKLELLNKMKHVRIYGQQVLGCDVFDFDKRCKAIAPIIQWAIGRCLKEDFNHYEYHPKRVYPRPPETFNETIWQVLNAHDELEDLRTSFETFSSRTEELIEAMKQPMKFIPMAAATSRRNSEDSESEPEEQTKTEGTKTTGLDSDDSDEESVFQPDPEDSDEEDKPKKPEKVKTTKGWKKVVRYQCDNSIKDLDHANAVGWKDIEPGVPILKCPLCDFAKPLDLPANSVRTTQCEDGRLLVCFTSNENIMPKIRKTTNWQAIRSKHLKKCVLKRRISNNIDFERKQDLDSHYWETFLPPLWKSVKTIYNQQFTKKPDGKINWKFYHEQKQKRQEEKIIKRYIEQQKKEQQRKVMMEE